MRSFVASIELYAIVVKLAQVAAYVV